MTLWEITNYGKFSMYVCVCVSVSQLLFVSTFSWTLPDDILTHTDLVPLLGSCTPQGEQHMALLEWALSLCQECIQLLEIQWIYWFHAAAPWPFPGVHAWRDSLLCNFLSLLLWKVLWPISGSKQQDRCARVCVHARACVCVGLEIV